MVGSFGQMDCEVCVNTSDGFAVISAISFIKCLSVYVCLFHNLDSAICQSENCVYAISGIACAEVFGVVQYFEPPYCSYRRPFREIQSRSSECKTERGMDKGVASLEVGIPILKPMTGRVYLLKSKSFGNSI
jgi:hypothetical protein